MRISRRDASHLIKRTRKQNKDIKDAEGLAKAKESK
jgi:hypothetical protein